MKFLLGQTAATPGALEILQQNNVTPSEILSRHHSGDWGDLDEGDKQENERSLKDGGRLMSAYQLSAGKVWVITEADRSSTTILLPEEY